MIDLGLKQNCPFWGESCKTVTAEFFICAIGIKGGSSFCWLLSFV